MRLVGRCARVETQLRERLATTLPERVTAADPGTAVVAAQRVHVDELAGLDLKSAPVGDEKVRQAAVEKSGIDARLMSNVYMPSASASAPRIAGAARGVNEWRPVRRT